MSDRPQCPALRALMADPPPPHRLGRPKSARTPVRTEQAKCIVCRQLFAWTGTGETRKACSHACSVEYQARRSRYSDRRREYLRGRLTLPEHRQRQREYNREYYAKQAAQRGPATLHVLACNACGVTFSATNETQLYCSGPCRQQGSRAKARQAAADRKPRCFVCGAEALRRQRYAACADHADWAAALTHRLILFRNRSNKRKLEGWAAKADSLARSARILRGRFPVGRAPLPDRRVPPKSWTEAVVRLAKTATNAAGADARSSDWRRWATTVAGLNNRRVRESMARSSKVTAKQIMELIQNQQFRCALTGRELTPETASIDHIVPLSREGSHDTGNIWVLDYKVNLAKGTMMKDEFVALCREVAAHAGG